MYGAALGGRRAIACAEGVCCTVDFCFSLRRYKPNQVQRDYLNSIQNTPKAIPNLNKKVDFSYLSFFDHFAR